MSFYKISILFIAFSCCFNSFAEESSIFKTLNMDETNEDQKTCDVTLVALNKITAKSKKMTIHVGSNAVFDNLTITVDKSFIDLINKESSALISVLEQKLDSDPKILFQGWIISPKQSLSTMNHPIYEILMIGCK